MRAARDTQALAESGHSASQLATTPPRRPDPTTIINLTRRDRATRPCPPGHSAHHSRPLAPQATNLTDLLPHRSAPASETPHERPSEKHFLRNGGHCQRYHVGHCHSADAPSLMSHTFASKVKHPSLWFLIWELHFRGSEAPASFFTFQCPGSVRAQTHQIARAIAGKFRVEHQGRACCQPWHLAGRLLRQHQSLLNSKSSMMRFAPTARGSLQERQRTPCARNLVFAWFRPWRCRFIGTNRGSAFSYDIHRNSSGMEPTFTKALWVL